MIPVNYLAVVAAAVASMILGYIWYGPLFGKQWMALSGKTMSEMDAAKTKGVGKNYAFMFIGSLVMSYTLSHALIFASTYLNTSGVSAGLTAGFWNWFGFIAPVSLGVVLWDGKPWKLFLLNAGYYLATLLAMGVILAVWKSGRG